MNEAYRQTLRVDKVERLWEGDMLGHKEIACDPFTKDDARGTRAS